MSPVLSERAARAVDRMRDRVTTAMMTFRGRWTMTALRNAEPGLAHRLNEALELWHRALGTADEDEILKCGDVVARGYRKCAEVMAVRGQAEDAYVFGRDPKTGFTIAIGVNPGAAARVAEIYPGVPFYTADDIAVIMADQKLATVNQVMATWPGAEVVEVRRSSHEV